MKIITINYDCVTIVSHYCDDCKRRFIFEFYIRFKYIIIIYILINIKVMLRKPMNNLIV